MPDLDAFLDWIGDGSYELPPINGKVYVIASPSIDDGKFLMTLWALGQKAARYEALRRELTDAAGDRPLNAQENRRLADIEPSKAEAAALHLDDDDERNLWERVLGPDLIDQMKADGMNAEQLKRIGTYAWTRFCTDEETADRAITEAGEAAGKADRSTGTARATTTRRPASGSATRSRKTASRR